MAPERPSYGLTKNAATLLIQQIAKDTKVNDMQMISFHPGGVLTDMVRQSGVREDMGIPFDDGMASILIFVSLLNSPTDHPFFFF